MSKKVYISPSDQVSNAYAWGNTNEHVQCQKIAEAEAAALRRSGVEVQVAALGSTMAQRCAQSNVFKADIHNCVHTNACNKQVMGTRLFCYAIPGKGYDACKAVFNELAPLTPGTSENVQKNPNLYEVRTPAAPTVYCECEFHDTVEGAKWIVGHHGDRRGHRQGSVQVPGRDLRPGQGGGEARRRTQGRHRTGAVPGPGGSLRRPRQRRQDAGKAESGGVCRVRGEREEVRL